MTLDQRPTRKRDLLNPARRFRDAITGRFCTRWYALTHPSTTVSERREP